jgi:rod shape determining protein RodA
MATVFSKRSFRDFDWMLALLAVGIVLFGTVQIRNAQPTAGYWQKQLIGLGISLAVMLFIAFSDYRRLINMAPVFYIAGLVLLLLVLVPQLGLKINGQRAWLRAPIVGQFQPSEIFKIPTVLMLTYFFSKPRKGALTLREAIIGGAILAVPVGLILLEPDAGQAMTYFPLLAMMFFLSGIQLRLVIGAVVLSLVLIPASYVVGKKTGLIKNYQVQRIEAILNPEKADKHGVGYHTWQSILTVGKGGLTGGQQTGEFSQSSLKFLPEPHSDFIFAVTAENTGFVGCTLLLLAYGLLISRLITGARRAPDRAGMLVIMAIVGGLMFSIFMNTGMALGLLPVVGVPLPLMSAGLSSILTTFTAIGLALSVQQHRFVN